MRPLYTGHMGEGRVMRFSEYWTISYAKWYPINCDSEILKLRNQGVYLHYFQYLEDGILTVK